MVVAPPSTGYATDQDHDPNHIYKSMRQSLRPLPQAPTTPPPAKRHSPHIARTQAVERYPQAQNEDLYTYDNDLEEIAESPSLSFCSNRQETFLPSRRDSAQLDGTPTSRPASRRLDGDHVKHSHLEHNTHSPQHAIAAPDLQDLQKSSTGHFRTLSRLVQTPENREFSISPSGPSVTGMHNRMQLKRVGSTVPTHGKSQRSRGMDWSDRWMDKQRHFVQAYEYLCHIGEAKEWIEDIIHKSIPPIVELEEALRNGVTLAEIVQAFHPERQLRIFRHDKLNFRHSDNIALFFGFLEEVGLPELFRFELIDLYEKKNIPKVIYCIHALSWLLYRLGMVDFRIGNLVGQLQFEHHELEQTQKGLDKAGVAMPSFASMGESFGAEPEPEPVETEEQRMDRELAHNEALVLDLQSQYRGAAVRMRLGDSMQSLWDSEDLLIDLQARIRGDWARQVIQYRLNMKRFSTNLQAATRGFLARNNQHRRDQMWRSREKDVLKLQSLFRARRVREETRLMRREVQNTSPGTRIFQAFIRGALARRVVFDQYEAAQMCQTDIASLQSAARGFLSRRSIRSQCQRLTAGNTQWMAFQSVIRGQAVRERLISLRKSLRSSAESVKALQACVRAADSREDYRFVRLALLKHSTITASFQAMTRGFLLRVSNKQQHDRLLQTSSSLLALQGLSRGAILRQGVGGILCRLEPLENEIAGLQALTRAMLLRVSVGSMLSALGEHEPTLINLQALARANMVRASFTEKQRYFRENMEKVVKIQSVVRAKIQGQAYKSLTVGKNPPVGTLKGFVHLLNDSDFDFDEEIEFERMRKTVVQQVRQNELVDQYVTQLDIKIALLVKNKITLDEVVKHQRHFGGHVGTLLPNADIASKDPFDLKALNKTSRKKLEHYQELFFILQTQPQYLSRLFRRIRELGTAEKDCERIKHHVMGLFGYAQKRREEYYLVKLISRSVREDVEYAPSLQDYLRTSSFGNKLFAAYVKSPRDRKFLRDVLGGLIKEHFIDNRQLDLESDPLQIYFSAINNEELRTGQRSQRNPQVPREEAIRDPETRSTFIHHMQDLRDITDHFFVCLESNLLRMPFGVRYIAQQTYQQLTTRFKNEDPVLILQLVGQWLWRHYLQPALLEPEKFGTADRAMTQEQRRNLGEVGKVLYQAVLGRQFGEENVYLKPLNTYIQESAARFVDIWNVVIDIPGAEEHYDIDEFNDLYAKMKPTLYIKMTDIFSVHQLLASEISSISPNQDDVLRDILRELGSVKSNENELMGVSSSEIMLTLNPKLHDASDPDADIKALFIETKRCVLYIIRVQAGATLLEILVKPVTPVDEDRWQTLVTDELQCGGQRGAYAEANATVDITSLSYADLKRIALENVLRLESIGRLTRSNQYQDLLNAIAVDIRTKHRRRLQRQREIDGVRTTLARLHEQARYLDQQVKTYNNYIEQAMVTLQSKKGRKKFLMPFTKQWDHERELQRSGRSFQFGSYKYSARKLAEKGVLVQWRGYTEQQWDRVDLTISSNEVGVFTIDGSSGNMMIPGANAQVPLDDLLQAQFNNTQFMEFFEGTLRVNVNLFLHLIMKKFYNE